MSVQAATAGARELRTAIMNALDDEEIDEETAMDLHDRVDALENDVIGAIQS